MRGGRRGVVDRSVRNARRNGRKGLFGFFGYEVDNFLIRRDRGLRSAV